MNLFKPNLTIHDDERGPRMRNNPKYETLDNTLPSINDKNPMSLNKLNTPGGALLRDIRMARDYDGLSSSKSRTAQSLNMRTI